MAGEHPEEIKRRQRAHSLIFSNRLVRVAMDMESITGVYHTGHKTGIHHG